MAGAMEMITIEDLRAVLNYDPDTGVFTWRDGVRWCRAGSRAGYVCRTYGYHMLKVNQRKCRAHHLAWLYVHGRWPSDEIDHINGDRADNRIANLREANRTQNLYNTVCKSNSRSGLKGAFYDSSRGAWFSSIRLNGKRVHLGMFDSAESAHAAYCEVANNAHGSYFVRARERQKERT
jgi:hypothetical protein